MPSGKMKIMSKNPQTIDWHQLRTLIRVSLKNDWRGANNPMAGISAKRGKIPGILVIMIMNLVLSIFLGAIFIPVSDLFAGMVIAATGAMIIVAVQVLLEFGNIIISPDDYHVIGPHPVNSRTFFAAKLLHLLIYVSVLSATVSMAPAIFAALAFKSFLAGPAILIHFWLTCAFTSVLVMNIYTLVLQKVDRRRLERLLGYMHMMLMVGFYMGLNILSRVMKDALIGFNIDAYPWLKALPAYWFAGPIRMIALGWEWQTFGLSLLGLALIIGLGKTAISYLSLSYAESLSRVAWSRSRERKRDMPRIIKAIWGRSTSFEERALLLLTRANFRHDTQFRMGIMGIVPIVLFYAVYGFIVAGSNVRDPLAPLPDTQATTNFLLGIAIVILPSMMMSIMHTSKSWQAAWIFYIAPYDRVKMIRAIDRIILWNVVTPIGLLMCIIYTYLYGDLLHALLHTLFLVAMAITGLTLIGIFSIKLPFAAESRPSSNMKAMLGPLLLSGAVLGTPIIVVGNVGYGGYPGWIIFMVAAIILNWGLGRGRNHRIHKVSATWEFPG
jgi:hypothetical protein